MSNWADNLINEILDKPETVTHTFKGEATTDPYEIAELGRGWQLGYDFTLANYTVEDGYRIDWPEGWAKGFCGNGFAEECIYGRSFITDRDYPGWQRISSEYENGMTWVKIEFKNGRIINTQKRPIKKHKNY